MCASMVRSLTARMPCALAALLVVCLAVMAAIPPAYAQPRQPETDFAAVDAYVEAQRQAMHIPGLALAIVQGDQVAYLHGYGQAAPDGRAVTPQTPFMIGSVTKSFTALAIMQLVEAGQIELDAPVQTYLPWFRVADPHASAQITVRQLLNQTSGFSTGSGMQEDLASDLSDAAIEAVVRRLADTTLAHAPGTVYEYSNANYNILGLIVQTVAGQSYERYIQEHIFDPLEMRQSFTSLGPAAAAGIASGHMIWFGMPIPKDLPFNRGGLPSDYVMSSVEDMARYLTAQLNDGLYGNVRVLSPQGIAAMHEPAVPQQTPETYYGMGWEIGQIEGVPAVFHGGDNPNFKAYVLMLPTAKLGVVVLTNAQGLSISDGPSQIAQGVLAVIAGKQPTPYRFPVEGLLSPIVGSVLVPVALALVWVGWTLFGFLRRQKQGLPARRSAGWYGRAVVLPLIVDLGLLGVLLLGIPWVWEVPLSVMATYVTELHTMLIGGVVALVVWGLARTLLTLRPAQSPSPVVSQPQAVP